MRISAGNLSNVIERLNRSLSDSRTGRPRRGVSSGSDPDGTRSDTCIACYQGQYAATNPCPSTSNGRHIWYGQIN